MYRFHLLRWYYGVLMVVQYERETVEVSVACS